MRGIDRLLAAVLLAVAVGGAAVFARQSGSGSTAQPFQLAAPPLQHVTAPGAVFIAPTPAPAHVAVTVRAPVERAASPPAEAAPVSRVTVPEPTPELTPRPPVAVVPAQPQPKTQPQPKIQPQPQPPAQPQPTPQPPAPPPAPPTAPAPVQAAPPPEPPRVLTAVPPTPVPPAPVPPAPVPPTPVPTPVPVNGDGHHQCDSEGDHQGDHEGDHEGDGDGHHHGSDHTGWSPEHSDN